MRHVIGRHRAAHGTPASWLKIAVAVALSFAGLLAAGSARADDSYTLTLTVIGPGQVAVESTNPSSSIVLPPGEELEPCAATAGTTVYCYFEVSLNDPPTTVTLNYGSLDGEEGSPEPLWGGCTVNGYLCTVTMDGNEDVSAEFGGFISVDTDSHVSISSSPSGINACDKQDDEDDCRAFFSYGEEVELTATWAGKNFRWGSISPVFSPSSSCSDIDTTPASPSTCTITVIAGDFLGTIGADSYVDLTLNPIGAGAGRGRQIFGTGEPYLSTNRCGLDLEDEVCTSPVLTDTVYHLAAYGLTPGKSVQWSANCAPLEGQPENCDVEISTSDVTVDATFGYLLTVQTVGTGTVSSTDPLGISGCGGLTTPDCTEVIPDTATPGTVRLQAVPGSGRTVRWSDECVPVVGSGYEYCDVTLDMAKTVTAVFGYELTVDTVDYPYFQVSGGSGAISCGANADDLNYYELLCTAFYPEPIAPADPTEVILQTIFNGRTRWSSDCVVDLDTESIDFNTCTVTMDQNRSVTATPQSTLTVSVSGGGTVSSTGSSAIVNCGSGEGEKCLEWLDVAPEGTDVVLEATPDDPATEVEWTGDACEVDAQDPFTCTITVDGPKTVYATFTLPQVTLDVDVVGAYIGSSSYAGYVTGLYGGIYYCDDRGSVSELTSCSSSYDDGSEIVLGAYDSGNVFSNLPDLEVEWSGCVPLDETAIEELNPSFLLGLESACAVTLDGDTEVTATFGFPLDVEISGTGTVSGGESIACGIEDEEVCRAVIARAATPTPVTVTAYPGDDREVRWEGCDDVDGDNCTVDIDEAKYVTATFGFVLEVERLGAAGAVDSELESEISDCGKPDGDCTEFYAEEPTTTLVTLTATPEDGTKTFDFQWTDCDPVDGHPDQCDVTMDQARSVTVMIGYLLHIDVTGTGASIDSDEIVPLISNCGDTPNDCEEVYAPNQEVTLTATLDEGLSIQWSDECDSVGHDPETCVVTMDAAKDVSAFVGYLLEVDVTGTGASIDSDEDEPLISGCGGDTPDCSEVYGPNDEVTLTATLSGGLSIQWSDVCDSGGGLTLSCTVTMDGAKSISATVGYLLTVTISGTGSGTVAETSPGTRIDCSWDAATTTLDGDCSEVVAAGGQISLDATTTSDTFAGWGTDAPVICGTTAAACVVTLIDADKTASATFSLGVVGPVMKDLTVTKPGGGSGTVTSSPAGVRCGSTCPSATAPYEVETDVVLTAKAAKGSAFRGWSFNGAAPALSCSGVGETGFSSTCTVQLTDDDSVEELIALFEPLRTLTVTKTGLGTVTSVSVPTQTNQIACGTKCSTQFAEGDVVTLTATGPGASTWGWTGCDTSTPSGTCEVTVDGVEAVGITFTASLSEAYSTITVSVGRGGYVDSSPAGINCPSLLCTATFRTDSGAAGNVVLTAHPATGYTSATWTGCPSGTTGLTCTISKGSALSSYTIKVRFTR